MKACENSGQQASDHFVEATEMIALANGVERKISDFQLSRYACYLIVKNADPENFSLSVSHNYQHPYYEGKTVYQ